MRYRDKQDAARIPVVWHPGLVVAMDECLAPTGRGGGDFPDISTLLTDQSLATGAAPAARIVAVEIENRTNERVQPAKR